MAVGIVGMAALAASLWGLRDVRRAIVEAGRADVPEGDS